MAAGEGAGQPGGIVAGFLQRAPPRLADRRLVGQQEGGAHLHGRRAQGQGRGDAPSVHDPARGDHRQVDGRPDRRDQGHGPYEAGRGVRQEVAAMAAGLGALGADPIGADLGPGPGLGHRGGGAHHEDATGLQRLDLGAGQEGEGEGGDRRRGLGQRRELKIEIRGIGVGRRRERLIQFGVPGGEPRQGLVDLVSSGMGGAVDEQVDPERPVGPGAQGRDGRADVGRRQGARTDRPQAPRRAHRHRHLRRGRAHHGGLQDGDRQGVEEGLEAHGLVLFG